MEFWQTSAMGVAIVVIAAATAWWIYLRHRTQHLRERFGPEYDRRTADRGSRRRAEAELAASESRVRRLRDRPMNPGDRMLFVKEWRLCQARFVDDPSGALEDADRILTNIMRAGGYAADDPNDRVTDISAAYPHHAPAYREANEILVRQRRGNTSTEELSKAFINIRSLLDEMLGYDQELRRAS